MPARCRVNELGVDTHLIISPPNASFQKIADPKLPAYLLHVHSLPLVSKNRISSDDKQSRDLREIGNQVFRHAVGEVFLLGIFAHVCEGQYGNGGFVGQRERRLFGYPRLAQGTEVALQVGRVFIIGISFAKILQRKLGIYLKHLCSVSPCLFLPVELHVNCR